MSPTKSLTVKELYSELISLTQLFLLRGHQPTDKCPIDENSFAILKPFVQKNRPILQEIKQEITEIPLMNLDAPSFKEAILALPPRIATLPELKKSTTESATPIFPTLLSSPEPKKIVGDSTDKKRFNLEPLNSKPVEVDLSYKKFFRESFPDLLLFEEIPFDQLARKIKDSWMSKHQILPVVILSFSEQNKSLTFLKNISKSITLCLAPACILSGDKLEKEQQWDRLLKTAGLRLVIACDYELYLQKNLMEHYRQSQANNSHFLDQTPLLLLSDLSLYLKRPELKSFLWNAICNILK